MVGVTAIIGGFLMNQFWPDTFSGTYNSPLFMWLFCIVFALGVAYIAYRGVTGTTAVNVVINIIQISALLVFSVIAIGYRVQHPQGSTGFHLSNGIAVNYQVAQEVVKDDKGNPLPVLDENNKPTVDKDGKPVYKMQDAQDKDGNPVPADKDGKAGNRPETRRAVYCRLFPGRRDHKGRQGEWRLQLSLVREIRGLSAWVQLYLHPGGDCDTDPGRVRVGDCDG